MRRWPISSGDEKVTCAQSTSPISLTINTIASSHQQHVLQPAHHRYRDLKSHPGAISALGDSDPSRVRPLRTIADMPSAMPDTIMGETNGVSSHPAYPVTNGLNGLNGVKESEVLKAEESDRLSDKMDIDATPRTLPSTYIPQFNGASRALILERIRSRSATPIESIRISDDSNSETSLSATLVLPESSISPRDLASLRASSTHQRLSLKRKRENTAPPSASTIATTTASTTAPSPPPKEFTSQTTLPLPTPKHAVYPQHYHPSPNSPAVPSPPPSCSKCGGRSTPGNILVACAKCPASLHQQCSTPPVDDFRARDGSFVCRECLLRGEGLEKKPRRQLAAAQQEDLERMRRRRLEALPDGVVPAKPSLVGFKGGDAPSSAVSSSSYLSFRTYMLTSDASVHNTSAIFSPPTSSISSPFATNSSPNFSSTSSSPSPNATPISPSSTPQTGPLTSLPFHPTTTPPITPAPDQSPNLTSTAQDTETQLRAKRNSGPLKQAARKRCPNHRPG